MSVAATAAWRAVVALRGVPRAIWRSGLLAGLLISQASDPAAAAEPPAPSFANSSVSSAAKSPAEITDFRVGNLAQMQQRAALLQRAEALLAEGDTAAAIDTLDRAAMMLHAPDTEMALVRAYLQAGEYRRALAFCAHTAGAHRETVAPSALYAWLLRAGGQVDYAKRVLAEAEARLPADPVLSAARQQLDSASPQADAVLLEVPQRMAPYAVQRGDDAPVPASAEVVASGVLIDGGRHALAPAGVLAGVTGDGARSVWLRNGLGETTSATIAPRTAPRGLVLLRLSRPLDPGAALAIAPRDPFAGSLGFALRYVATSTPTSAWPWLHAGFLGGPIGPDSGFSERRLGIAMPPGPRGGPVFDAAGRLAGLAAGDSATAPSPTPGSGDRFVPVSAWRQALGDDLFDPPAAFDAAGAKPPARLPNDEVYERALRVAVQVIVAR